MFFFININAMAVMTEPLSRLKISKVGHSDNNDPICCSYKATPKGGSVCLDNVPGCSVM